MKFANDHPSISQSIKTLKSLAKQQHLNISQQLASHACAGIWKR